MGIFNKDGTTQGESTKKQVTQGGGTGIFTGTKGGVQRSTDAAITVIADDVSNPTTRVLEIDAGQFIEVTASEDGNKTTVTISGTEPTDGRDAIVHTWNGSTNYRAGEMARSSITSIGVYVSIQDNNLNHPLTDTDWWVLINPITTIQVDDTMVNNEEVIGVDTEVVATREWVEEHTTDHGGYRGRVGFGLDTDDGNLNVDTDAWSVAPRHLEDYTEFTPEVNDTISLFGVRSRDGDTEFREIDLLFAVNSEGERIYEFGRKPNGDWREAHVFFPADVESNLTQEGLIISENHHLSYLLATDASVGIDPADSTTFTPHTIFNFDTRKIDSAVIDTEFIADTDWVKEYVASTDKVKPDAGYGIDTDGNTWNVDTDLIADTEWVKDYVAMDDIENLTYNLLNADQETYANSVHVGAGQAYIVQGSGGHTLIFVHEPHSEQRHHQYIKVTDSDAGNFSIYQIKYTSDFQGGNATEFVCARTPVYNSNGSEVNEDANTFIIEANGDSAINIGFGLTHDDDEGTVVVDTDVIADTDWVRTNFTSREFFFDSDDKAEVEALHGLDVHVNDMKRIAFTVDSSRDLIAYEDTEGSPSTVIWDASHGYIPLAALEPGSNEGLAFVNARDDSEYSSETLRLAANSGLEFVTNDDGDVVLQLYVPTPDFGITISGGQSDESWFNTDTTDVAEIVGQEGTLTEITTAEVNGDSTGVTINNTDFNVTYPVSATAGSYTLRVVATGDNADEEAQSATATHSWTVYKDYFIALNQDGNSATPGTAGRQRRNLGNSSFVANGYTYITVPEGTDFDLSDGFGPVPKGTATAVSLSLNGVSHNYERYFLGNYNNNTINISV